MFLCDFAHSLSRLPSAHFHVPLLFRGINQLMQSANAISQLSQKNYRNDLKVKCRAPKFKICCCKMQRSANFTQTKASRSINMVHSWRSPQQQKVYHIAQTNRSLALLSGYSLGTHTQSSKTDPLLHCHPMQANVRIIRSKELEIKNREPCKPCDSQYHQLGQYSEVVRNCATLEWEEQSEIFNPKSLRGKTQRWSPPTLFFRRNLKLWVTNRKQALIRRHHGVWKSNDLSVEELRWNAPPDCASDLLGAALDPPREAQTASPGGCSGYSQQLASIHVKSRLRPSLRVRSRLVTSPGVWPRWRLRPS